MLKEYNVYCIVFVFNFACNNIYYKIYISILFFFNKNELFINLSLLYTELFAFVVFQVINIHIYVHNIYK